VGQWPMGDGDSLLAVGDLNGAAAMIFVYQIIYLVYFACE